MLNINKTVESGKAVVVLEGRLDTNTAPQLETELKETLEGVTELVMDFEKLEYISSAGLRVLMVADELMEEQGRMKLIHVSGVILEVLEITGITDIISIE